MGGGGGGGAEEEEVEEEEEEELLLLLDEDENDEDAGCGGARLGSGPRGSIEGGGLRGERGEERVRWSTTRAFFSAHGIFAIAGTRDARRVREESGRGW